MAETEPVDFEVLPESPGTRIIRAAEVDAWLEGYRFLGQARQAYDAEYARGYAEGKHAGAEEAAILVAETAAKVDRYLASLDREIAGLAVTIVRRILADFDSTDLAARVAVQALADFRREKWLKVTVHPEAVERVRTVLAERVRDAGLGLTVTVDGDPELAREGCVVSSEFAVVDAGVESQLAAVAAALGAGSGGARP